MNGDDKKKILNSADKGISATKLNGPAQMFRRLLVAMKIDGRHYDNLLRTYLERTATNKDPVSLASDRGNLNKALLDPKVSWKTFIRGVDLLGIVNLKITIHAELPNNKWISVDTDEIPIRKKHVSIFDQEPNNTSETEAVDEEDV